MHIYQTKAYQAIKIHYGRKVAKRSGVPLINHIDEGLVILSVLNAGTRTLEAWCMHPLVQADADLQRVIDWGFADPEFNQRALMLAMEYRYRANSWLSDKVYTDTKTGLLCTIGSPSWSLLETKQMLIADKVQNYKDFCNYHKGKHERSAELDHYFTVWLDTLGVTPDLLAKLYAAIDKRGEHDQLDYL